VVEAVPPPAPKPKPDLPPVPETITLSEAVTVKELAEKLNRKSKDVIAKLLSRGVMATINQPLEPELALELAKEFGSSATFLTFEEEQVMAGLEEAASSPTSGNVLPRPPVVTVMGHVDHGKTSLLDAIRAANVVDTEHGGITQHIGAYQVEEKGRKITFLDTPGHEAFTMMRARGARVTDVVVLVVAADDGVKPQTLEAIDHAKAAGVPMVVAINKIDKPDARPERVKQQLADREILVEEYGGKTVACEISAKKRQGIEDLLDMILLVADLQELKADAESPANGVVLEARLDRARGTIATILVQSGTLRVGDPFIAGAAFGKIRAMTDEHGRRVDSVGPSTPVEIMGFQSEPTAGDAFQAVADEQKARQIAQMRQEKIRAAALAKSSRRTLESLSREIAEGSIKELSVLVKADVQGSLEALQKAIGELPSDKIRVNVLRASTGAINQADALLASASNAIIVGFNVRPDRTAAELARQEEVEIRLYTVIYDVVNDIKQAMVGLLEPTIKETIIGQAEVRQLFKVPKVGTIAGSYVTEGRIARSAEVRLIRDNVVIYTGRVGSLRRFKDDASEVKQGFECGIGIANFNDLKEGDVIEFFVMEKVAAQSL
jgi:translation initiation factor IF-2